VGASCMKIKNLASMAVCFESRTEACAARGQVLLQVRFGRPGCALNRPTSSPIKGSSARVSTIRSAIVVRQRVFWIRATDTDIISAQHFWTGGLERLGTVRSR